MRKGLLEQRLEGFMAAGDATAAVVPLAWLGWSEVEQAVAAVSVATAGTPPAIRIPLTSGLQFSLPRRG
jgi:hypothetical protein